MHKISSYIQKLFKLRYAFNWAPTIGDRLARSRPFYSNDVILLHQVTVTLHQGTVKLFGLHQLQSNDMTQNCISSETHNWYMHQKSEEGEYKKKWKPPKTGIETQNQGFKQMVS